MYIRCRLVCKKLLVGLQKLLLGLQSAAKRSGICSLVSFAQENGRFQIQILAHQINDAVRKITTLKYEITMLKLRITTFMW